MYLAASGTVSRRQFVSSITTYFGDKLLLLYIEGCESVVGFKAGLGQFIKIAKKNNSNVDDDELEKLVRKICSEVRAPPWPGDYNISYYARHTGIESTGATLLKLVSSLVSGGATTKPCIRRRHHQALHQEAPSPSLASGGAITMSCIRRRHHQALHQEAPSPSLAPGGAITKPCIRGRHHQALHQEAPSPSLASGGAITKPPLTLAQCIQQHTCGAGRNQTTLGLAVKHHNHDSSGLIKTPNEHGITSTYDEVLCFCKSVAKFVLNNHSDYHRNARRSALSSAWLTTTICTSRAPIG